MITFFKKFLDEIMNIEYLFLDSTCYKYKKWKLDCKKYCKYKRLKVK